MFTLFRSILEQQQLSPGYRNLKWIKSLKPKSKFYIEMLMKHIFNIVKGSSTSTPERMSKSQFKVKGIPTKKRHFTRRK